MKKSTIFLFLFLSVIIFADNLAQKAGDGTPIYSKTVSDSYHTLQFKMSIYEAVPEKGKGIRLGIYQVQAAYGKGATEKKYGSSGKSSQES